jgi:hypothetical protein
VSPLGDPRVVRVRGGLSVFAKVPNDLGTSGILVGCRRRARGGGRGEHSNRAEQIISFATAAREPPIVIDGFVVTDQTLATSSGTTLAETFASVGMRCPSRVRQARSQVAGNRHGVWTARRTAAPTQTPSIWPFSTEASPATIQRRGPGGGRIGRV